MGWRWCVPLVGARARVRAVGGTVGAHMAVGGLLAGRARERAIRWQNTREHGTRTHRVASRGFARANPPRGASAQQQHARKVKHAMYFNNAAAASLYIYMYKTHTHTHGLKSSDSTR